jgi:type VI secretion system protein ImpL
MEEARTHVERHYRRTVLPECRERVFRRYPVYADSSVDISVDDFTAFFGYGGIMETFFNDFLSPFVAEGRRGFQNAGLDGVTLGLEPNTLRQLQLAEGIKRNFFATAGGPPVLSFTLRPTFLDARSQRAIFDIGDQKLDYRHEPPRALPFVWPPDSGEEFVALALVDLVDNRTRIREEGPWAFLRFLDRIEVVPSRRTDRFDLTVALNDLEVRYAMEMDSVLNAVTYTAVSEFRCPVRL